MVVRLLRTTSSLSLPPDGRKRVVIEGVAPEIDGGRFAIKRTIGETVAVQAAVFADGHDLIACQVLYKYGNVAEWLSVPMTPKGNDCWEAAFPVSTLGRYFYTVQGWIDRFKTWRFDLKKRIAAQQDVSVDLLIGAELIESTAQQAAGEDPGRLLHWAEALRSGNSTVAESPDLLATMQRYPDLQLATTYERELPVVVDRQKARFSTWYELFPRSTSTEPGRHGTFADCEKRLPYVASMGFDVVYASTHPSCRSSVPEGKEQFTCGGTGRCRKSLGHRR